MFGHLAGRNLAGPRNDERGGYRRIVGRDLLVEAVLAETVTLIGGVDDEGVFQLAGGFERGEHAAYTFVDGEHTLVNLLNPRIVGLAGDVRIEVALLPRLAGHRGFAVWADHPRLSVFQIRRLVGPGTNDVCRHRCGLAGERSLVAVGRRRWTVDRAVAQPQIPGFVGIAVLAFNVVDGPVGVVVGGVTLRQAVHAVEGQDLIGIIIAGVLGFAGAVPDDLIIPVTAEARVGAGVPLADLRGVVALFPKLRRHERRLGGIVTAAGIFAGHRHALDAVLQAAREQRGARRHAPRAEIAPFEAHAALREAVDVRRFDPVRAGAVAAEGFVGLVVGVDEENIGPLGGGGFGGWGGARDKAREGGGDEEGTAKGGEHGEKWRVGVGLSERIDRVGMGASSSRPIRV